MKIVLPSGSVPNALYKLRHVSGGGEEYVEIPSSLYTISGNTIELTLVDGGPDDEDGEVNGVIVDPLVPVVMTKQTTTSTKETPACVRNDSVTVRLGELEVPQGVTVEHSEILVNGRVAATLGQRATAAVVSFAGLRSGHFEVTVVATLSNGKTVRQRIAFRACASAATRKCVSQGSAIVYLSELKLPRGVRIEHSEILIKGRVAAKLGSRGTAAIVNFGGQRRGPYAVTLEAKLSTGKSIRRRVVLRACAS